MDTIKKLKTINRLQNNGFRLRIAKLPNIAYWCKDVQLPSAFFNEATFATPLQNIPTPGDKMLYESFKIEFDIDSQLHNYKEIYKWLVAMAFPQDHEQYDMFASGLNNEATFTTPPKTVEEANEEMRKRQATPASALNDDKFQNLYSDALLDFLDPNNKVVSTMIMVDTFPVFLNMQSVQSNVSEPVYMQAVAEFKLQHYYFLEEVPNDNHQTRAHN